MTWTVSRCAAGAVLALMTCLTLAPGAQASSAGSAGTALGAPPQVLPQVPVPAATQVVVSMEATVKAAQVDPRRADEGTTPGARGSVLVVERALQAEHLLDARFVDGSFGTRTVEAYAAYQRSLGWSGLAANGLPGRTSLTRLGEGRFVLTRPIGPGARVHRDGVVVDTRTRDMLEEGEQLLGHDLVLDQGSYNPGGDPTSAGTHDGGGVVDVSVSGMTAAQRTETARDLRRVGFAAWVRSPRQGDWPWHIHAVAISDTDLSSQAQHQVGDYYLGLDGPADRGPDDGPRIPVHTWEEYQRQQ